MFVLLRFISGVPPLEEHMRETRGAAWDAYAARTSAFFPLPPG
jgi:steroid 5-alpha reductase family enzyme